MRGAVKAHQPDVFVWMQLTNTDPTWPPARRAGLIIIGQYKAITAQNGFNRRIFDEFQEAQDNQFLEFLALKFIFLSSGTPKIGSGRSNLYIGRWSRGRLTPRELELDTFVIRRPKMTSKTVLNG